MTNFNPEDYTARLIRYFESDPDNLFYEAYIENYPEANFAAIAIQRLSGMSLREIAERLDGISPTTLGEFYQGWVRQFAPQIRAYLDNDLDNDPPNNGNNDPPNNGSF